MKRADGRKSLSVDSVGGSGGDEGKDNQMFLSMQNKALVKEMKRCKRSMNEQKKELELMRVKSREMEALVSVIQRAWSQLDVDLNLLLDALGDSDNNVQEDEYDKLGMFKMFLTAGSQYRDIDCTDITTLYNPMKLDEWSSTADIENARKISIESIKVRSRDAMTDGNEMSEDDSEGDDLGTKLDQHLMSHTSFTLSLLEKLCICINHATGVGLSERSNESLGAISQSKVWSSQKLILEGRIEKLATEIINIQANYHISRLERIRAEKEIDKLKEIIASKESGDMTTVVTGDDSIEGIDARVVRSLSSEQESELQEKISLLEKQLAESESAKAKVEMTLTERLARPLQQTEAQISDMRKSMEDLRQQHKYRVSVLVAESSALQEQVKEQDIAIIELEKNCKRNCEQLVSQTQEELSKLESERDKVKASLISAQAEVSLMSQLRTEVAEQSVLIKSSNDEIKRLNNRIKTLSDRADELESHLTSSRKREIELEKTLAQTDSSVTDSMTASAARTAEMQQELDELKMNMEDLILEIESVSESERSAREQVAKLLEQAKSSQNMQRGVLEENLRLHDEVEEAKNRLTISEQKMAISTDLVKQQDAIIASIRQEDQQLRTEISSLKKSLFEANCRQATDEQTLLEVQQKHSLSEHAIESAKKRNMELQARCGELSKKLEEERKLRMALQKDAKSKKKVDESAPPATVAAPSMNKEDVEMLEITLGMLRCSVCRDRFKEVALCRCFHLFCKECIDENIRNRNRKCPACGEKFGQDDVKTIYFTH